MHSRGCTYTSFVESQGFRVLFVYTELYTSNISHDVLSSILQPRSLNMRDKEKWGKNVSVINRSKTDIETDPSSILRSMVSRSVR